MDVATAVTTLAQRDAEINIESVARILKLPELHDKIIWTGPYSSIDRPDFFGYYIPRKSSMGIERVVIRWTLDGHGRFLTSLTIVFRPGSCPDEALLSKAIGSQPRSMPVPGADGGPSYEMKSFSIKQSRGEPVAIIYNAKNTCNLLLSRFRSYD
ncbi:hypothetical protein [Dyella sp. GSA-30]|uniref:hypothetical protein n=1 Tax=Dyella sp. GSA-30 TaxID=2994496 RepID=UPI002490B897|nr:hypothetical protein [Dyella sp. GSA-30]